MLWWWCRQRQLPNTPHTTHDMDMDSRSGATAALWIDRLFLCGAGGDEVGEGSGAATVSDWEKFLDS